MTIEISKILDGHTLTEPTKELRMFSPLSGPPRLQQRFITTRLPHGHHYFDDIKHSYEWRDVPMVLEGF